jgi:hypothetical protein
LAANGNSPGANQAVKVVVDIPEDKKQARPALTSESIPMKQRNPVKPALDGPRH